MDEIKLKPCPGSSPHMRGAGVDVVAVVLLGGIIPARAGSSMDPRAATSWPRDHPRACGEQRSQLPTVLMSTESSPRMRGAGGQRLGAADTEGIIPAHAGSSPAAGRRHRCGRNHPRVCGEQTLRQQDAEAYVGSSPRVRGAAIDVPKASIAPGIIPARAGSSRACGTGATGSWNHPRAGGEQELPFAALVLLTGSSPRMRGAEHGSSSCASALGIIPARAGSSCFVLYLFC